MDGIPVQAVEQTMPDPNAVGACRRPALPWPPVFLRSQEPARRVPSFRWRLETSDCQLMTICPRQMVSVCVRQKNGPAAFPLPLLPFPALQIHSLQILAVNTPIFPLGKELSVGCRRVFLYQFYKEAD